MDNSNKAIARRINKELKSRDWSQTLLLKKIIAFKNPNLNPYELQTQVNMKKGNFSASLKGNNDRAVPKEDLYIISKILKVPLEYIWFGDEKKSGFIPSGSRYVAYQDSENEYRSYFASLVSKDRFQYGDEFGFNLFDYFGQFDSINGYKFFVKNYNMHFDYTQYGQLVYVDGEGYISFCSAHDKDNLVSNNLIMTLVEHKDLKTFKTIYFDGCPLKRFNPNHYYFRDRTLFKDDFLETLLQNEEFLDLTMNIKEVELNSLDKHYEKGEKRSFVEPMFYEALSYALDHEEKFKEQLLKMLRFTLTYNKSQFEFIRNYLSIHKSEYSDVRIDSYAPRFLRSSRNILMGNVIRLKAMSSNEEINNLLNKNEQCVFNMTHIINEQEKSNDDIKISTPDNPLFIELHNNANNQNVDYVPAALHIGKEFTSFQHYESNHISFENLETIELIIDYLNKAQNLVAPKPDKILVHGNLSGPVMMVKGGKIAGLAGWQKCHYGNKYEDRAEILSNVEMYSYDGDYLKKYKVIFDLISRDFNEDEKVKLVDKAIDILNKKRKQVLNEEGNNISRAYRFKEQASKLEFFKELYLTK